MITRKIWSLLALVLLAATVQGVLFAAEEKEGEGQDEKVALDKVPAEILAAAVKAVDGFKRAEAEKETKGSTVTWELKGIAADKKTYEVELDAAGKVLKTKEVKAGDKEDGDKDDDDKDEDK